MIEKEGRERGEGEKSNVYSYHFLLQAMCLDMRVPMACHDLSCKLEENLLHRSVQLFGLEQKSMSLFSLNSRVEYEEQ